MKNLWHRIMLYFETVNKMEALTKMNQRLLDSNGNLIEQCEKFQKEVEFLNVSIKVFKENISQMYYEIEAQKAYIKVLEDRIDANRIR